MGFDFENAFATTEAYNPSGGMLRKGKHVVTIKEVNGAGTSSGGYPEIDLRVENGDGYQKDRLYVTPKEFSIAKIMGLIVAAGIRKPASADVDVTDGRLSPAYLSLLEGKKVGIVVDDEEDSRGEVDERTGKVKMWPRVKGYVPADTVDADVPIDQSGLGAQGFQAASDDDIPF